jgi:uncharacterized protein (DUF2336 family)
MIVRRFLLWSKMVSAAERADGVSTLARAFLYGHMEPQERKEALAALTSILDDPSPLVRKALADSLGSAMDTPRHIAVTLANDQSDIASLVLARSPVLTDADLIDAIAVGDNLAQTAVGIRPGLSGQVATTLADAGCLDAVIALADNKSAHISDYAFMRMIERFGDQAQLRGALEERADLPIAARQAIAKSLSDSLANFTLACGWLNKERGERVTRETREKVTLSLSLQQADELEELIAYLRESHQLTPALILRALLSKSLDFVCAAFADLTNLPLSRVIGLMTDRGGAGFSALYRKSGLPGNLAPAFHAGVATLHAMGWNKHHSGEPTLSRELVSCVMEACEDLPLQDIGKLMATLRRFEAEAAREEARIMTERMSDEAALETLLDEEDDAVLDQIMSPQKRFVASADDDDVFQFDLSHLPQRTLPDGRKEPILMVA